MMCFVFVQLKERPVIHEKTGCFRRKKALPDDTISRDDAKEENGDEEDKPQDRLRRMTSMEPQQYTISKMKKHVSF